MTAASQVGLLTILLLTFAVTSCSWTGKDGTRHSLVIGIGVLSTKKEMEGAALITKTSLLGVALQSNPAMRGLIVGYSENLLAQIPPRWEGLNSLFSATKRKARGYRTTRYLIAMLYFVAGKLNIPSTILSH